MTKKIIQIVKAHAVKRDGLNNVIQSKRLKQEKRFTECKNLSTAIAKLLKKQGKCTKCDLVTEGFFKSDVNRHWLMAYALAKVELNWMDG